MTEAAFRAAFVEAYRGVADLSARGAAADAAVAAARAAGVVFAPEAPVLPDQLRFQRYPGLLPALYPAAPAPYRAISVSEMEQYYEVAAYRYNAWPTLREAAVQVVDAGRQLLAACAPSAAVRAHPQGMLDAVLDTLEAVLAQEPKS